VKSTPKQRPLTQLTANLSVDQSLDALLRKLLLQSKDAEEETDSKILFHTFNSHGVKEALAFFDVVKKEPRSSVLELYCTCLSCLLISGAHDELALRVALELRSQPDLELDETGAQLIFAAILRQRPPPAELYQSLAALVVGGLLTSTTPTDVCNAALYALARGGGDVKVRAAYLLLPSLTVLHCHVSLHVFCMSHRSSGAFGN
jgi:hypothetical protein